MDSIPAPPEPDHVGPLRRIWPRGQALVRCHHIAFGATEFNPGLGRGGRFHPFAVASGAPVATLYASQDAEGALSETVFHNVPVRGAGKRLSRVATLHMVLSSLACRRDLVLAQLFGLGLKRLGATRLELIEGDSDTYAGTRIWSRDLHAARPAVDGLVWVSRQNDASQAVVLFGDRVARDDLDVTDSPLPLAFGRGLDELERVAERAGILLYD